jgi:ribosomal protein S12 methylthiotransferase accessory factor
MKEIFIPFLAARIVVVGQKTIFYINENAIIVEAPRKLMEELVVLCNGKSPINHIVDLLKHRWDKESLLGLIDDLRRKKIIINASGAGEIVWELIEKPIGSPPFLSEKDKMSLEKKARQRQKMSGSAAIKKYQTSSTSYSNLLKNRKSIRVFSGEVSLQNIINMLWSAYGELENGRRTVPSAGALYPLQLHVALLRQTEQLLPAIYRIHLTSPNLVEFDCVSMDINSFARSFINPMIMEGAHGVIVISGSFQITAEKYGTRSLLYVIIEAGHVAQNINLAAVEHGIAVVEIGGFKEEPLARAIHLSNQYHPLITIVFGHEDKSVKQNLINTKVEVQWQIPTGQYQPPFIIASARLSKERSWSQGRDISPRWAYIKAIAEAKEWTACGNIPNNLVQAKFADLENAIDPRSIIKFHPAQYRIKGFPFKPFDEALKYAWTKGYDEISGSMVYILADHVYFPYFPKTPYYCYANSSGVAAHPEKQKAIEISTLELIERDSFMIAYLTRLPFPTIQEKTLPGSIRKRIRELQKNRFRVWIKNHTLDFTPVICVIAQSEEFTYTPCASCASFDVEYAIDHAFMEVEALILARLENGPPKPIKPHEVIWPLDHGKLYGQKLYFHRADFLIYGHRTIPFKEVGKGSAKTWNELIDRFSKRGWHIFTVPLHLSKEQYGNDKLHIIRSIIPGLVPMTFGFRQEPVGMKRIYVVAKELGGREFSYRELTKFPHPFA